MELNEVQGPLKIKTIKGVYGDMNIWVEENMDEVKMVTFNGETSISLDKIDELIKTLKRIKKYK